MAGGIAKVRDTQASTQSPSRKSKSLLLPQVSESRSLPLTLFAEDKLVNPTPRVYLL